MEKKDNTYYDLNQIRTIIDYLDLDPKEVLPELATKKILEGRFQHIENFNVRFDLIENDKIRLVISGVYEQRYRAGYKPDMSWRPSEPLRQEFKYEKVIESKE